MGAVEQIPHIIDDLYAGALDEAAWRRAIAAIINLVSGSAALIFGFNPKTHRILRDENHQFDPGVLAAYRSHFASVDIRMDPGLQFAIGDAMFEGKLVPVRDWKGSEIYNDLLLPGDSPWVLAFWLHKAPDKVVLVSIQGSRHRGPYDESDGERIKPLIPHLRRALEIKDRLEQAHIHCDTLGRGLDRLSFAVLVLDVGGRIIEASTAATELIRANCGLRRNPDGTLWLREPAGTALNQWLKRGVPPAYNSDGLLHVPRPLAGPLTVMITRLPEVSASWFSSGPPSWMLLLFDPDRQLPASTELIARDLGVSMREAEVAALLVNDYDIKVVAQRLNMSIHTARTHLKTIFSKTGSHSQVELICRIARGPAGIHTDSTKHRTVPQP
jgi:DNA-binding CsgD family transcriptional regulator